MSTPPQPRSAQHAGSVLPEVLPVLRSGTPILVRRKNMVQVGSDPHRSILLELDPPVKAADVAKVLQACMERTNRRDIRVLLREAGLTATEYADILAQLLAADLATVDRPKALRRSPLKVRIHGRGPLARFLATSLPATGITTSQSSRRPPQGASVLNWNVNLVVLTDFLVHEPVVVRALTRERIPHLQVRVRDGVGLVGPLVLPGLTSCLHCADHHRAALEPEWPMLAAQLQRVPGRADTGTVHATAALAHTQIEQLTNALRVGATATPPELADRVLELHSRPTRVQASHWPAHALCDCRSITEEPFDIPKPQRMASRWADRETAVTGHLSWGRKGCYDRHHEGIGQT